jgi:hypothetical protein
LETPRGRAVRQVVFVASRSHDAVIRVYDAIRNVIATRHHKGDVKEW